MNVTQTTAGIRFSLGAWGGKGTFPDFEFSRAESLDLLEKLAWALGYRVVRASLEPTPRAVRKA